MAFRMGLLGKKIGMTQTFDDKGNVSIHTVVEVGPCVVVDKRTPEKHGYCAIALGFDDEKATKVTKPQRGFYAKVQSAPKRFVKEIRLPEASLDQFSVGQTVAVDQVFSAGDVIDATGTSKGKGFQGVMKRHKFSGFRATHGTHEYFRHGGSIGCRLTPGRTFKGMRMPGHMGARRVTAQNLKVSEVIPEKNLLLIEGSVPGAPQGYVVIKQATKRLVADFTLKTNSAAASTSA